jgi:hypothetical protein
VSHPDGVKAVLAGSRAGYSKGTRFYKQIGEAFGRGLLTSEGELWQRQRRLVQPLFTRKQVAVAWCCSAFRISSDQDTVPLDTAGITLRPKGAVPIRLAAR